MLRVTRLFRRTLILSIPLSQSSHNLTRIFPIIVSRNYPPSLWTGMTLRMYLHFSSWCNYDEGDCYHGKKSFSERVRSISKLDYIATRNRLEAMGLVRCRTPHPCRTHTTLLVPPTRCSNGHLIRRGPATTESIQARGLHFIRAPKELLLGLIAQNDFTDRDILVFIKILQFWQPEVFGGIDPNAIHLKNERLAIDPFMFKEKMASPKQ